jgi:hypothetical protein
MPHFFSLPAEIRLEVYRNLIPNGRLITFKPSHVTRSEGYAIPPAYNARVEHPLRYVSIAGPTNLFISTNLFLVNRQIYQEAINILYHENTFRFTISHAPARIHGCCIRVQAYEPNLAQEFPMLKPSAAGRIKNMDLWITGNVQDRRTNKDLRKWLTQVASNLTEGGSQLEQLRITLTNTNYDRYRGPLRFGLVPGMDRKEPIRQGQYVLEPLMQIRGIKNVVIEGEFLDCFPTKLARVMGSQDLSLPVMQYEDKVVWRRRSGQKKKSKRTIPGRMWFDPVYDWSAIHEAVEVDGK